MKKAMIFAAGLGTRLGGLTQDLPKALVELNGITLLERNIHYLKKYGYQDIVVNVHHHADKIIDFLRRQHDFGLNIYISDERETLLETGGGLLKAREFFSDTQTILLINADVITNLDLDKFQAFHQAQGGLASLAVRKRNSSRKLLFDKGQLLCGWRNDQTREIRQARPASQPEAWSFSGVQLLQSAAIEEINLKGKFSITNAYLQLATNFDIHAYPHDQDYWFDVGKPETLSAAANFLG